MSETYVHAQKEFDELKVAYQVLQGLYKKFFPKVDPRLLQELISHTSNSSENKDRMYSLQVIAKKETDPQKARVYFVSKTGKVPGNYEEGSHYVINVFPTLDMLKDIQSFSEVEHISGDYTFGSSVVHSIQMHRGEDEQSRIREA